MPVRVRSRVAPNKNLTKQAPAGAAPRLVPATGLPYNLPQPARGATQLPRGVSLCMIVKDEERYLEQCLRSAAGAVDEICIVDTGSTDRTVEIARQFGARIEHREWRDDFAWARNEAIAMATKRWIFMLDADEELDPKCKKELLALKDVPAAAAGLYVRCHNLSDDYKGTGSVSHLIARIFPNNPKVRFISPVHEYVTYDGVDTGIESLLSTVEIIHHGYLQGIVAERNKAERNFALIRRATERNPEDPFHWYNLGMTAHIVKDYEQAILGFERMRELLGDATRAFLPQSLVALAEAYADGRNDDEKAIALLKETLAKTPNLGNGHFTLGRVYEKMGRREEAREAFLRSIDTQQFSHQQFIVDDQVYKWKAQLSIGATYAAEHRFQEALGWYERGLANQPRVQPLVLNRAHALEGLERFEEAERAFLEAHEFYKDDSSTSQYINYLLRRRNYVAAETVIAQTLNDVAPRTAAMFQVGLAAIASRRGDAESELRNLESAFERCPSAGPVIDALDKIYQARGEMAKLKALQLREFEYEPEELPDFVRRSYRLLALKRYADAEAVATSGLRKSPADPQLCYNLAVAKIQMGNGASALADLAIIPGGSEIGEKAALLRATVLRDAGRFEEALGVLDAGFPQKINVDGAITRAQCNEGLGRIDDAVGALETAFSLDRARVAIELASLYMRAGRFDDARRAADRVLAAN